MTATTYRRIQARRLVERCLWLALVVLGALVLLGAACALGQSWAAGK